MEAPEIKTKAYVAYPPPKFHTTTTEPTQVPPIFNKKEWSRTPTSKFANTKK